MEDNNWTPADILQMSGSYWSACALHAAVKLDIFSALVEQQLSAAELTVRTGFNPRGLQMLLRALVALGLLEKSGETFTATFFAAQFLSRSSPAYLGHIILHHHHLMTGWAKLDEAVRLGLPVRENSSHQIDEAARESFLMGMFNLATLIAPKIVTRINLDGRRRLLDLGGGPGTYAIHFCQHNPGLEAVIYDLPSTQGFARQTIDRFGLGDRIAFHAGDFLADLIPSGFDVAWLSHILHGEGPENCALLLAKTVKALDPKGLLLVQEFIRDDNGDRQLFPELFSLNMLINTEHGQSYSQNELFAMLADAGLVDIRRIQIELPNGAGVVAGRVPDVCSRC